MSDFKYKAFISYSHADSRHARWLQRALESYRLPGWLKDSGMDDKPLRPIFRDEDELAAAPELGARIEQALSDSEHLIVLCSPSAARSEWVNNEIRAFRSSGKQNVYALIVEGEHGHPSQECFPRALIEGGHEPLAADITGNTGRRGALLKLVAGILDIEFDDLRQRESRRRQQRLVLVAGASFIGMLLTGLLAFYAVVSRNVAEAQRARAELETRRATAFNEFMQATILSPAPLEGLGREVTVAETLASAATRIPEFASDDEEVEASLGNAIGTAFVKLGRYDEAGPLVNQALNTRRELFGEAHLLTSESALMVAEVTFKQGSAGTALDRFRNVVEVRRRIPELEPVLLAEALDYLAETLIFLGRYDEAEVQLQEALQLVTEGKQPRAIAETKNKLGIIAWNQGDHSLAKSLYREAIAIEEAIQEPNFAKSAGILNNLGVALYSTGDIVEAEGVFRKVVAVQDQMFGPEHEEVATAKGNLAAVVHARDRFDEAERLYREALRIDEAQLGSTHANVAVDLVNLGRVLRDQGKHVEGCAFINRSVQTFRRALDPGHWRLGSALHQYGSCLVELKRFDEAESHLEEAVEILEKSKGNDSDLAIRARELLAEVHTRY